jgi:chromate transporter
MQDRIAAPAEGAPSFREAVFVWAKVGLLSFGGPAAQIALMHRIIVEEKRWMAEPLYLSALSFCMLLPGPEAMQLATYAGWRLHGTRGGLAAGLLFVLPGAFVILSLSAIYVAFGNLPLVVALFLGIKSAVLVIVIEALLRIGRRALKGAEHWAIAALGFAGIFFLALPFPLIVLAAAAWGFMRANPSTPAATIERPRLAGQTIRTALLWLTIWLVPLGALALAFGPDHILAQLGAFFSRLAVVTFGGAYAVLAYMSQDVVIHHHWLEAGQMMDGLGLAETTPGPLILVTEFVGFLAGWRQAGGSWLVAVLGAAVALWATFVPCFLWIFTGGPYIEWITRQARLKGALDAITAAVVGVILNLAVWFALHVFFAKVDAVREGPLILWTPDPASLDWRVAVLAAISAGLLLYRHWNMVVVLALAATGGLVLSLV